ncbi:RNA polymerase sigma factor [Nocardia carnea]|uniref:RNA polymerase sigma factor n=1 Tax=Nocardia carnea TaxID=37328 RepID=UPI0024549E45|nr:sigma-70 family RNA polymerase sigma factor [Nocardia carnea]
MVFHRRYSLGRDAGDMRFRSSRQRDAPAQHGVEDRVLFETIYRREYPCVRRYLLGAVRGDSECAEDLTHEVFLQVWRTYGPRLARMTDTEVQQILITAAKNRLIDLWRKDTRVVLFAGYDDHHVPVDTATGSDPFCKVINDEVVARFAQVAARQLTIGEYRVAFMSWVMECTDTEIAAALGTTVKTVRTHRCAARRKIKAIARKDRSGLRFLDADEISAIPATPGIGEVTI